MISTSGRRYADRAFPTVYPQHGTVTLNPRRFLSAMCPTPAMPGPDKLRSTLASDGHTNREGQVNIDVEGAASRCHEHPQPRPSGALHFNDNITHPPFTMSSAVTVDQSKRNYCSLFHELRGGPNTIPAPGTNVLAFTLTRR